MSRYLSIVNCTVFSSSFPFLSRVRARRLLSAPAFVEPLSMTHLFASWSPILSSPHSLCPAYFSYHSFTWTTFPFAAASKATIASTKLLQFYRELLHWHAHAPPASSPRSNTKPNVKLTPTPSLIMAKLDVIIVNNAVVPPMLG